MFTNKYPIMRGIKVKHPFILSSIDHNLQNMHKMQDKPPRFKSWNQIIRDMSESIHGSLLFIHQNLQKVWLDIVVFKHNVLSYAWH